MKPTIKQAHEAFNHLVDAGKIKNAKGVKGPYIKLIRELEVLTKDDSAHYVSVPVAEMKKTYKVPVELTDRQHKKSDDSAEESDESDDSGGESDDDDTYHAKYMAGLCKTCKTCKWCSTHTRTVCKKCANCEKTCSNNEDSD
jgi:hypothetical protein